MRAQFATIEAVACIMVVAIAVSAISMAVASGNKRAFSAMQAMRLGFAEHDFIGQAYGNASLHNCLNAFEHNASGCIVAYITEYSAIYGLPNFSVSTRPVSGGACFAYVSNAIVCFGD